MQGWILRSVLFNVSFLGPLARAFTFLEDAPLAIWPLKSPLRRIKLGNCIFQPFEKMRLFFSALFFFPPR